MNQVLIMLTFYATLFCQGFDERALLKKPKIHPAEADISTKTPSVKKTFLIYQCIE